MPIRVLDAATVGRIAAGEVVERPSSVVKELMENSIDAKATSITVEIRGGGIDYLRVTDNGCGIEPGQVRLAFENHATSKLQNAQQLDDIRTLGFRGEALPSIASVSRVEMSTRARKQDTGTRLTVEGGQNLQVQETGCPEGTTLIMRDLFFNIPVRRAFLKKPAYEGGLVSDAVARMILGNPGVSVRFINNGNNVYHSFGDGKLRHAVFAVYGKSVAERMVEVDASEGGTRIYGLIGVGELARSTRAHQMFFINGRSVRCPLLTRALEEVCRSRVTIGMYPMCALDIVIPPTSVDVNVHPNKFEVRFRDEIQMRMAAERLLATAFEGERVLQLDPKAMENRSVERVATVREIVPPEKEMAQGGEVPKRSGETGADKAPQVSQNSVKDAASVTLNPDPSVQEGNGESSGKEVSKPNIPVQTDAGAFSEKHDLPSPVKDSPVKVNNAPIPSKEAFRKATPLQPAEKLEPRPVIEKGEQMALFRDQIEREMRKVGVSEKRALREDPGAELKIPSGRNRPMIENKAVEAKAVVESNGALPIKDGAKPAQEEGPEVELPPYRVLGVLLKTYILIEANDSLLLIDQHAAHERLQYEKYMARLASGTGSQQLLTPLIVHLSGREMALIQENMELIQEAGYEVEPFGEMDIQVRAVPYVLGRAELKPAFMDMINSLNRLKNAAIDARRAEIMQMACKSAVKAGDALSESEVQALIRQMLETGAPPTCPHGRPVMKSISRRELEKMFKRIQ